MKKLKKLLILVITFCIVFSQCMSTQAATSKYQVTLNKSVYTMKKGKTVTLKATLNSAAKKKGVEWSSSNKSVATVSSKGKITAKKNGKATITVKVKGTKIKATCKIVVGTPVTKVTLNKSKVSLQSGGTFTLKPVLSPKKPTNSKITYTTSNKMVATVSSKGVIKAVAPGTAEITATAADGSGKKAICTVTVEEIAVSNISLNATTLTLKPGQTSALTAAVKPSNATDKAITWSSSDSSVASVGNNGSIKAVGEGAAEIKATAASGKTAVCSVKVAYSNEVSNQAELNQALSSKMITDINYSSTSNEGIVIPSGDYSTKTITINAPNADVTNNGSFAKVVINAIAQNTYRENSNNVIYFNALQGHIIVDSAGNATINLAGAGGQELQLENNGYVNNLNIPGQTALIIGGSSAVPVTLGEGAGGSNIVTTTRLNIMSGASWNMTVLPGAENTRAEVTNANCMPTVFGVGNIPVMVTSDNELVNIYAEMRDDLGIDQMVEIAGNVQEIKIEETEEIENIVKKQVVTAVADQANIYLIPYSTSNKDMETNYESYLEGVEPTAITDENGDYTIEQVRIGNYWMVLEKEGYKAVIKSLIITSSNTEIYSNGTTTLLSDEVAATGNAEQITGTIIDGLTGDSIGVAGVQIKLRAGSGNIIGEVIQNTTTDSDGKYALTDVPAGLYTVEVIDLRQELSSDTVRYNSASVDIIVVPGYLSTDGYNCVVNQQMESSTGEGQVQFTLTWGTRESGASSDIDSHLLGPSADGNGTFHVYYADSTYHTGGEKYADLDVDDTDYEGPEHTTIYKESEGVYRFYIHNYSQSNTENSNMMAKSSIQVRITIGTSSYVYNCPNSVGNLWYVCDYNSITHTIIPKNEMSTFIGNTRNIGLSPEELNELYLKDEKLNALERIQEFRENLAVYNDNAAKTSYLNQAAEWESLINSSTDYMEIQTLYNKIEEESEKLGNISYPLISADNMESTKTTIQKKYDEEGNLINSYVKMYLSVLFNELENFTADSKEGQTVSFEALDNAEDESIYVVHVALTESGLSYDIRVSLLTNSAQRNIVNRIAEVKAVMSMYDTNDDIASKNTRIAEIESQISTIMTSEQYYDIINELSDISRELEQKRVHIISASAEDGVADWWTSTDRDEDEEGNIINQKSVLYIERYEEASDEDVLDKLNIAFDRETVTHTIAALEDNSYYQALIKATDSETGYTQKIYVRISEW